MEKEFFSRVISLKYLANTTGVLYRERIEEEGRFIKFFKWGAKCVPSAGTYMWALEEGGNIVLLATIEKSADYVAAFYEYFPFLVPLPATLLVVCTSAQASDALITCYLQGIKYK